MISSSEVCFTADTQTNDRMYCRSINADEMLKRIDAEVMKNIKEIVNMLLRLEENSLLKWLDLNIFLLFYSHVTFVTWKQDHVIANDEFNFQIKNDEGFIFLYKIILCHFIIIFILNLWYYLRIGFTQIRFNKAWRNFWNFYFMNQIKWIIMQVHNIDHLIGLNPVRSCSFQIAPLRQLTQI